MGFLDKSDELRSPEQTTSSNVGFKRVTSRSLSNTPARPGHASRTHEMFSSARASTEGILSPPVGIRNILRENGASSRVVSGNEDPFWQAVDKENSPTHPYHGGISSIQIPKPCLRIVTENLPNCSTKPIVEATAPSRCPDQHLTEDVQDVGSSDSWSGDAEFYCGHPRTERSHAQAKSYFGDRDHEVRGPRSSSRNRQRRCQDWTLPLFNPDNTYARKWAETTAGNTTSRGDREGCHHGRITRRTLRRTPSVKHLTSLSLVRCIGRVLCDGTMQSPTLAHGLALLLSNKGTHTDRHSTHPTTMLKAGRVGLHW